MSGGSDPSAASPSRRKRKQPADASSVAKKPRPSDADAVAVLRGVLDFRARTGANPTLTTMDAFYDSIRGSLPSPALTKDKVYNKLRHLRYKFQHSSPNPNPNPHAHHGSGGGGGGGGGSDLVYRLSADIWGGLPSVERKPKKIKKEGEKNKIYKSDVKNEDVKKVANEAAKTEHEKEDEEQALEEVEEEEEEEEIRGIGTDSFPILIHEVTKYWKQKGLSTVSLEASLKLVRPSKARPVEEKWRKLMGKEMKSRMKMFEVLGSLLLS